MFSQYGTGQRIGFAITCAGFILCIAGSIAPYWITAETSVKDMMDFGGFSLGLFPVFGDIKLLKINVGIWWYCIETVVTKKECAHFYNSNYQRSGDVVEEKIYDRFAWINFARLAVAINVVLSLACGLVACCRCVACSGGRTICHGIMSFLAGAAGFAAFLIVYNRTNTLVNLPIVNTEYAWALVIYTVGSGMMVVASFFMCFGVPKETGRVLVPSSAGAGVNVIVPLSSSNQYNMGVPIHSLTNQYNMGAPIHSLTNQYNMGAPMLSSGNQHNMDVPIQSFEPLPNPTTTSPPPPAYAQPVDGYIPGQTVTKFDN